MEGKIAAASFYTPANRVIFEKLVELYNKGAVIDIAVVAEELKISHQLDEIGGYAYLTRISGSIPTTAQAGYFIEKVRELHILREIIIAATSAVENCYNYDGDGLDDVIEPVKKLPAVIDAHASPLADVLRPLDTFTYPVSDPNILIGPARRYLGRGGSLLIPAPSGIGKSTASYHMAACWGVGRDWLGLSCTGPLRVLLIQAEDDEGDVGEVAESIKQGLGLTPAEAALFHKNVHCIKDRANIAEDFIDALRAYVRYHRPDIVIINPLMRYCPGLSKEEIAGPFLSALDHLADEFHFLTIAFHHTPKPPAQDPKTAGRPQPKKDAVDRQYTAFGSSSLTNWARAIINMTQMRGKPGHFIFSFDKRGTRAGLYREVPQGMAVRKETVTEIHVCHSTRQITVEGRQYPMILWERCEPEPEDEATPQPTTRTPGGRPRKYTDAEVAAIFPLGEEARLPLPQIKKLAAERLLMPGTTFSDYRYNLMTSGAIAMHQDGRYYRLI